MGYFVILNPKSGTVLATGLSAEALTAKFHEQGLDAEVDDSEAPLEDKIARALASKAEVVVCAGGDGTATAVARGLVKSEKVLAVLPLGTANLLARDLGLPLTVDESIAELKDMQVAAVDAGEVNGKLFLHQVVVGVLPSIAAVREKVRGGGPWQLLAFARHLIRRLSNARKTAVSISSRDTQTRVERIHAISVANNSYDQGLGKVFARSCLTAGTLTLYILRRLSVIDALRLAVEMLTGRWQQDDAVSIETVRSVTLGAKKQRIAAMVDGEVEILETPLSFRIRPKVLRVMVPADRAAAADEQQDQTDAHRSPVGLALWPS